MNEIAIFWPMIAHVVLVYIVYGVISERRIVAVQRGSAKTAQFRENREEPAESIFARNNLANQFELPILFHVCCLCLYVTRDVNILTLVLAWVFVASRYMHAAIHITTNRIRHRRPLFIVGYIVLGVLWIVFALHLLGVG